MASVTSRIKTVIQPEDGYIAPEMMSALQRNDSYVPCDRENISSELACLAVNYLTRIGISKSDKHKLSVLERAVFGAVYANEKELAKKLYTQITSDDENSAVLSAIRLAEFEVYYKTRMYPVGKHTDSPNTDTVKNIGIMANRCIEFFSGKVISCGFDFEGGYSDCVCSGKGGYLTESSLWNIALSDAAPSIEDTLELLVYYIMGLRSYKNRLFKKIKRLGIYNPRLGKEYTISVSDIPKTVFAEVSEKVIGYK